MNNDEGNSNSAPHSTPRSQNSVTEDSEATSFTASAFTMPGSGSEEYAQLQEILSDFVMTGGRGAGYISGSFVDQNEAAAEVDSSLGRLFAHYKVLESRVTKLEAHVFGNLRGHSRLKRDYGKSGFCLFKVSFIFIGWLVPRPFIYPCRFRPFIRCRRPSFIQ